MAKNSYGKSTVLKDTAKVANIAVAAKTLAVGADYSKGYEPSMHLHINKGPGKDRTEKSK